ncbi:hypothetical protein HOY80DRAFT_1105499 [Tuber brumale]|nr:hypothetical protein HOY80DRAFT_1105499 [Tuber brumale]
MALAAVILLGGMVLKNVTSTAGATLVNQLGSTTINLLSTISLSAVVVTEYIVEKTQERITRKAEEAVSRGTGGRINPAGSSARSSTGFTGGLGGAAGPGVVRQRVSLATSLMKKKMNGDVRLATGYDAV